MSGNLRVTKALPLPSQAVEDEEVFVHEFNREDVRELIHTITKEIKIKGTKTPLVFLSFRPQVKNDTLTEFLAKVFPTGAKPASLKIIERAVASTDELTLISALKYLWARLPGGCVVGWDSYEAFKKLEARNDYSKKAFLEYMPQCLTSPSHSSIVYDFLELLVALGGDSRSNQLSGRKIAKMAGIWAFQGPPPKSLSLNHTDPMLSQANSFTDGLNDWLPAASSMFHLLLSFLRSMLPDDSNTKLQLPRALQALLASNAYPPPDVTFSSSTLVHIPLVTIRTNSLSKSPIELINKVPKVLNFEDQSLFEAKEDYALLKSLCRSDDNILNKLSAESRRIIEHLCQKEHPSNLNSGWVKVPQKNFNGPLRTEVAVGRVSIDDYFIWSWLASVSFEQTARKKNIFGRSLISEVIFDGFKKWIVIEEQNINLNIRNSKAPSQDNTVIKTMHQPMYTSMLDGLPDPSPTTRSKKQKPRPIPIEREDKPLPAPTSEQSENESKSNSIMKTFKKLNQNHQNYKRDQQQQRYQYNQSHPPALPKKDSFKLEPVEGLPEIEREQYRLSIPLDSIGFEDDERGYENYGYEKHDLKQESFSRENYDSGYQSYANQHPFFFQPQQSDRFAYNDSNQQQQYIQEPKPQELNQPKYVASSILSREPPAPTNSYPNLRPEPSRRSGSEIRQALSSYDDPEFTPDNSQDLFTASLKSYDQSNVNGLSDMVDQIKIHVNNVERSLEGSPEHLVRTGYEVDVPLPSLRNNRNYHRTEVHEKVEHEIFGNGEYEPIVALNVRRKNQEYPEPTSSNSQRITTSSGSQQGVVSAPYESMILPQREPPSEIEEQFEPQQPKIKPQRRKPHTSNTSISSIPSATSSTFQSASSSNYAPTPVSGEFPESKIYSQPMRNQPQADNGRSVSGFKSMIEDVEQYQVPPMSTNSSEIVRNRRLSPERSQSSSPTRGSLPPSPKKQYEFEQSTVASTADKRMSAYPGEDFIDTYRAPSMYFQKGSVPVDPLNLDAPELPRDFSTAREFTEIPRFQPTAEDKLQKKEHQCPGPRSAQNSDVQDPRLSDKPSTDIVRNEKVNKPMIEGYHSPSRSPEPAAFRNETIQQLPIHGGKVSGHPRTIRPQQNSYPTSEEQQNPTPIRPSQSPYSGSQEASSAPHAQSRSPPQLQQQQQQVQSVDSARSHATSPVPKLTVQGRTDLSPHGKTAIAPHGTRDRYMSPTPDQGTQLPMNQQQQYLHPQQPVRGPLSPNRSITSETPRYRGGSPGSRHYAQPTNGSALSLPSVNDGISRKRSPNYPMNPQSQTPSPNRGRSPQQAGYLPLSNANYLPPSQQGYPPQGYYSLPPQGQGYLPQGYPPQGYPAYPPQGYYPLPPGTPGQQPYRPPGAKPVSTASDFAIGNQPTALGKNKLHHNAKGKKKDLRNALAQGDFGI